jgi:hypothetical protein
VSAAEAGSRLTADAGVRGVHELLQQALSGCTLLGLDATRLCIKEAILELKKETR